MDSASFSYTIYIHATADQVWDGLVNPELTRRYWFHENVSDWQPGSEWVHRRTDAEGTVDIAGRVIDSDPPNRLVISWAPPADVGNPAATSRVSYELATRDDWPFGPWTGLHLVHSELVPGSEMLHSVSFGWPAVLSGLKSVIESPEIFTSG